MLTVHEHIDRVNALYSQPMGSVHGRDVHASGRIPPA